MSFEKALKTFFCLLLCSAVVFSCIGFSASADGDRLLLTVASDLHFSSTEAGVGIADSAELFDSELYFHASVQGQMNYESEAIINQFLKEFSESDSDILLVPGDLTGGQRSNHIKLAEKFSQVESSTGKQIYVVCGNHDIDDDNFEKRIGIDEFREIYADFGYSQALYTDPSSGSYTADLGDGYRLIAVDSCIYGKDSGQITESVLRFIDAQSERAKEDGVKLIGMMHHSLLQHFTAQLSTIEDKSSEGGSYLTLAKHFADCGIKYFFTGHIHANDISEATSKSGNKIYDIMTGSLITSPNAYREILFTQSSVNVSTKHITEINTAFLPAGYTAEQLRLIESDFPAYSYGFFEAGMARWLNRYIGSAYKVSRLLKVDEGTEAYKALDAVMSVLGDALALPLYDNGSGFPYSLESIVAESGSDFPESDYTYVYQAVAAVMGGFYKGDESFTSDSPEVKLIISSVKAALAYSIGTYLSLGGSADSLLELLGIAGVDIKSSCISAAAQVKLSGTVAGKLIGAFLLPLIEGIFSDAYAPGDLNVTLEPFGVAAVADSGSAPLSVWDLLYDYFLAVFEKLFSAFSKSFSLYLG